MTVLLTTEDVAETARQSHAAWRLAEERYRAGVGDYLTVIDSQTRAVTADSQLLAVRRAILDNRVDLHLALGGGFRAPERPEEPTEEPRS